VDEMPGEDHAAVPCRRVVGPGQRWQAGLVRALVVDAAVVDEAAVHVGVRRLLSDVPGYSLIGSARSVSAGEHLARRARPRLLICEADIGGHSGIGLCGRVRQACPAIRVAILTGRDEPLLAQSAFAAGAHGYLLKDSAPDDLAGYLDDAAAGLRVLDPRLGRTRRASHRTAPAGGPGDSMPDAATVTDLGARLRACGHGADGRQARKSLAHSAIRSLAFPSP
jgi:DNA-binding NarL/FixJ family response regulator